MIGLVLLVCALYVIRIALPRAYPAIFKITGAALVTRTDIDKVSTVYATAGAVGGVGLALMILGLGRRR